jgi:hypothetical protein
MNDVRSIDSMGRETILLNLEKLESKKHQFITDSFIHILASQQTGNKDIYLTFINSKKLLRLRKQKFEYLTTTLDYDPNVRSYYFEINHKLFGLIEKDGIIANLKDDIKLGLTLSLKESFHYLNDTELIGLDSKNGARVIGLKNDTLVVKQHFFDKQFISTACVNQKETLFLGTFGNGIYVIPNRKVVHHTYDGLFLGIASSPKNEVYLSSRSGEIYKYKDQLQLIDKVRANVDEIFYNPSHFKLEQIVEKNIIYDTYNTLHEGIKDICWIDNKTLLLSDYNQVALWTTTAPSSSIQTRCISDAGRCVSVEWSATDSLAYYTTSSGVLFKPIITLESVVPDTLFYKGKTFIAKDLLSVGHQILCATNKHGILVYEKNKLAAQFSIDNGLLSNNIKKIEVQDSILYLLGSEGLQLIDLKTLELIHLGVAEGLITEGITNFSLSQDKAVQTSGKVR